MEPSNEANAEGLAIEQHLIDLTKTFNLLFNARMYEHPFLYLHVSPNVRCDIAGDKGKGVKASVRNYKAIADASPAFQIEVCNASAIVDEKRGFGVVLFSQEMANCSETGRRMAGAISFTWTRKANVWVCDRICKMFGTPEFLPTEEV